MTDSPNALTGVLTELGWKPEALARRLNNFAALHGRCERMHPKTPYKWLHGDRPRSPWPALLAALLSEELGRPITTADLGWGGDQVEAVSAISGLILPWTAAGSLRAIRVVTDAGSMDRRILLTLMGTGVSAPAHEWLIARPEADAARSSGLPVSVQMVDHLDNLAGQVRRMDDEFGSDTLLPLIRAQLRYVLGLLDERRYTDSVGRRLHASAAELMRLAGWSLLGREHPQAQRYWVAGLHAAHAAGDRALGANIVGIMSLQAIDLGQIREAVTLAETARTGYPGASPRVGALLDLRAAEAHAADRSVTECRRALDTAFDRLGNTPGSSGEPDWCYWIDEAQSHTMAGRCYLRLQDWGRARQHLRTAVRLRDHTSYARESALDHIKLATTYLRQDQPEVDHAVTLATQAVQTLTGGVDSAFVVGHLTQLVSDFAPYRRRPAVRQLTEQTAGLRPSVTV
ncbi:MAG: hypothetical protein JO115_00430 [Pseudonocardiales bacterium]|nr:hypothetical protein [Pseudonocardiales bacterium]